MDARIIGFGGALEYDTSKPDGMPRKVLDVGSINALGWRPRISLVQGIAEAYADFLRSHVA
jgi:GDP-L-fucose synthase